MPEYTPLNAHKTAMATDSSHIQSLGPNVTILSPKRPAPKKWLMTSAAATPELVAPVAAGLGALIGAGAVVAVSNLPLGLYMMAMGGFHFLEFIVTAKSNPSALGMNSFLLTNGIGYAGAQLFAAAEYTLRRWYGSAPSALGPIGSVALTGVLLGQSVRTAAMVQAAQSFNHYVQVEKKDTHKLVRTGLYGLVRHPAYFGYYAWAVATQLLLRNWVSFVLFAVALNVYFRLRLGPEEAALVRFFANEYSHYRSEVWSGVFLYK